MAAAKSLQSCPTLCDPKTQPTRLPHPWDSPGKDTGVVLAVLENANSFAEAREAIAPDILKKGAV